MDAAAYAHAIQSVRHDLFWRAPPGDWTWWLRLRRPRMSASAVIPAGSRCCACTPGQAWR